MENRIYYGQYSLWHWTELVLKRNIVLPEYQRYFVWEEKQVSTLIETFKENQFVPPVTIGAFKISGTNRNLILDGQQRITSILLAYLGLYPDEQTYRTTIERFANENDEPDEDGESQFDNILEWNIETLTEKGRSKEAILEKVRDGNYKSINLGIDDDFLKKTFLGFSYLVPQVSNENEQQKYYSSVFRNINIQGKPLLPQESRASFLLKEMYENHLYQHRNRVAHNTQSYQQNLPTLKTLESESYRYDNYFIYFAILILIDNIFIDIYSRYLETLEEVGQYS